MLYPLQAAQLIESTMSMLGVEGLRVTRESKENQFQCVFVAGRLPVLALNDAEPGHHHVEPVTVLNHSFDPQEAWIEAVDSMAGLRQEVRDVAKDAWSETCKSQVARIRYQVWLIETEIQP